MYAHLGKCGPVGGGGVKPLAHFRCSSNAKKREEVQISCKVSYIYIMIDIPWSTFYGHNSAWKTAMNVARRIEESAKFACLCRLLMPI